MSYFQNFWKADQFFSEKWCLCFIMSPHHNFVELTPLRVRFVLGRGFRFTSNNGSPQDGGVELGKCLENPM